MSALRRADGSITTEEGEIRSMFTDAMSNIVGLPMDTSGEYKEKLDKFLEPTENSISEESRTLLGRPFSRYEVEHTVLSMKKEKAPGPDGIQAEVLQKILPYAGQDLYDLLNWWRREGSIPKEFNTGLIKLIPKGQDKLEMKNYRPLTMLNTVYKVMAKALASSHKSQGCC